MASKIRGDVSLSDLLTTQIRLTSLPNELLIAIANNLDRRSLSRLIQANHRTCHALTHILYDDVVREPTGYKPHLETTYKIFNHCVCTGLLGPMANLLVRKVDPPPPIIKEAIRCGRTKVLLTMIRHNEAAFRKTVRERYEINSDDEYPLTGAVSTRQIDVIRLVLLYLSPRHRSILQATKEAISGDQISVVTFFMRRGMLSNRQICLAFLHACELNKPRIAGVLISHIPTAKRPAIATRGVSTAIANGQPHILRQLIALGGDLHVSAGLGSGWGEYVEEIGNHLHGLASQGVLDWRKRPDELLEIYQILLTSGLDVNQTNSYGDTILMTLAKNGPKSIDRSHRPSIGQMRKACVLFRRLFSLILSMPGVDVNVRDVTGETVLGIAIRKRDYRMQRFLIQHGVDTGIEVQS
ncbi:uncharacterized protein LAJ45_03597 [Morchella importuna]|uniref:uncharacterized protein n=1 Tax=Morchella importuna TaxID=1174673 RepID=UPI001E8EA83E|nr:uncharacterized protein LAJ45_03597 [Morchella importuna]KAH8152171.1 hypothetical protein LAJ45_03597 [Morchella importuna]